MNKRRFRAFFLALVTCGSMLTSLPSMEAEAAGSIESALTWAVNVANDDSHWYSQLNRNGPNYDCSSLVFYALKQAGYDVGNSAFTTRNMRGILTNIGFEWIPWSQIGDKSNLQRGDILLDEGAHTEFYLGDSKCVAAANSDQGIIIENYWNGYGGVSWDGVLRYHEKYDYTDRWPEKPIVHVDVGYSNTDTLISWQACKDIADPYFYNIYTSSTGEEYTFGHCGKDFPEILYEEQSPEDTCVKVKLPAGQYFVEVTACNHEYLTTTTSDRVYFTVSDPPPKEYKVDFVVDGEVIESRTVLDGATVGDMPTAPKKDGFAFREWTEDDGKESVEVHSNLRYTAVYDPRITGDVSLDFTVNETDAKLLASFLVSNDTFSDEQLKLADYNGDNKVNAVDLSLLKRQILINESVIVTINKHSVILNTEGESKKFQLSTSYINPDDVVWKSSNPSIVTVSASGLLTAQKDGQATVTANVNGESLVCSVEVKTAYTESWSKKSDWDKTPVTGSDTRRVYTDERPEPKEVSVNLAYVCGRTKEAHVRQFYKDMIDPAALGYDVVYGVNTTQGVCGVPYITKSFAELEQATKIPNNERSYGDQWGYNRSGQVGYCFDNACIWFEVGRNTETVMVTYYCYEDLIKTPVVYDNN